MEVKKYFRLFFLIFIIFFLAYCGKKGAPKPPEYLAPMPVSNFVASGSLEGVMLSWIAPERMANGDALEDLDRFFVYRSKVVKDESPDYEMIQEIAYLGKKSADSQAKETVDVDSYSLLDKNVNPGEEYDYYVLPVNQGEVKGQPSPVLRITFIGEASAVRILPVEETEY